VLPTEGVWLDGSLRPIWQQIFPARYEDADLFEAFDALDAMVAGCVRKQEAMSLLVDVSRVRVGSARHRQRIAKSFQITGKTAGEYVVGQAFVMRSSVQRGALTAIFWLVRPGWPIETFETRAEALAWLQRLHAERGARPR
jgi:hypothetical protein